MGSVSQTEGPQLRKQGALGAFERHRYGLGRCGSPKTGRVHTVSAKRSPLETPLTAWKLLAQPQKEIAIAGTRAYSSPSHPGQLSHLLLPCT